MAAAEAEADIGWADESSGEYIVLLACIHTRTHTCTHTQMCVCVCVCVCVYMCVCVCVCVCVCNKYVAVTAPVRNFNM
jgi:hypothetical protein